MPMRYVPYAERTTVWFPMRCLVRVGIGVISDDVESRSTSVVRTDGEPLRHGT
jgi:hypothetical protein